MSATMECQTIIITGDLNLDRLKPEEQLLLDLEKIYDLKCLITKPTRVTLDLPPYWMSF